MLRLMALIVLAGAFWAGFSGQAERWILFPFDPTRVSPAAAGVPGLTEVEFPVGAETLVVWTRKPGRGRPVIFYLHGNAGNLAVRAGRFAKFTRRGFGVVAMGYRGSSGSSGTPSVEAINADIAALYRALPRLVGDAPVVLYGESLGTGIAAQLNASTATDPQKGHRAPAAMVLEAPYSSILDIGRAKYPYFNSFYEKLPEKWNTARWIATRDTPLLVLHGDKDEVIPQAMGRAVFDASAARDKRFYSVRGAGHTDVWQPDAQAVLWTFLGRF